MKVTDKFMRLLHFLFASLVLTSPVLGASLSIGFNPTVGTQSDSVYPGVSTQSTGTSSIAGIVPTLTGRGYGVQQAGTERWGVAAGPLAWDPGKAGWTVRNGFAPDAVGSTLSTTGGLTVDASYLSITLSGATAGTVFSNVALTFTDVTFLRPSKAWVGTSADEFSTASNLRFNARGGVRQLSVVLPEFTYNGGDPLEIRIFGVIGSDEGAFNVLTVNGTALVPVAVPETDARMLIVMVGLSAGVAFRRRTNSLRRFDR
jgi:hypothetical protein